MERDVVFVSDIMIAYCNVNGNTEYQEFPKFMSLRLKIDVK